MFKAKIKSIIKASLFIKYIFYGFKQRHKELPRNQRSIVFTLDDDRLYRDDDGMGRYAYLTLNLFSEAGYNVYLHKNVNTFREFLQLGRYGRFMYSVKNLKIISEIPDDVQVEETFYAFDTVNQNLIHRKWKQFIYVNITKPDFCKVGRAIWAPYYFHPIAYKGGMHQHLGDLRARKRKLRVLFAGNTAERSYSSKRFRQLYDQLTRFESITAVLEIKNKVKNVETREGFLKALNDGPYINECWLIRTDHSIKLKLQEYWNALSRSDFFLCFSGTDYPMCHNTSESIAAGAIPVIGYSHWMSPPMEHGKNAIIFSGRQDLKNKVNEIFNMTDAQIQAMRNNVMRYYDEHLSCKGFIDKFEADNSKVKTIVLFAGYVPAREEENAAGKALLEQLNLRFKDIIQNVREANVKTAH